MNLSVPMCDFCKHYFYDADKKKMCCTAFPNGIPLDKMPLNEKDIESCECNNGIGFEDDDNA